MQTRNVKSSRTTKKIMILVVFLLLILILVLGSVFYSGYKKKEQKKTLEPVESPIAVIQPEATPMPTPIPTAVPTPSQIPEPTKELIPKEVKEFSIQENRNIAIFSYYNVAEKVEESCRGIRSDTIHPNEFEKELKYLRTNGYDTIWFEDLREMEKYEKPVILTFDGSYESVYTNVFPLLQKYQTKITVFVCPDDLGTEGHLNETQLGKMVESGFVSLQCGASIFDDYETKQSAEELQKKLESYREKVGRISDTYPIAFAYPAGYVNREASAAAAQQFRFCVRRGAQRAMNTSKDSYSMIYRYTVDREMYEDLFENLLKKIG